MGDASRQLNVFADGESPKKEVPWWQGMVLVLDSQWENFKLFGLVY